MHAHANVFYNMDFCVIILYMKNVFLSHTDYARKCGVTPQAISYQVRVGRIKVNDNGKIDPNAVENREYEANINRAKASGKPAIDYTDKAAEELNFNPLQNNYEITRLNKAKADKEVLAYATKLNATIDIKTLTQKFNVFMDFVVSDLIAMPDDIADMLWSKANGSSSPEASIRADLKDRVSSIIENAQAAAEKVVPEIDERKYTIKDLRAKPKPKPKPTAEPAPLQNNA